MSRIVVPNAANARLMKTRPIRPFRRGSGGGPPPPPPLVLEFDMGEVPAGVPAGSHADLEVTMDGVRWTKSVFATEAMRRLAFLRLIRDKVAEKLEDEGRWVSGEVVGSVLVLTIVNVLSLTDPEFNFTGP